MKTFRLVFILLFSMLYSEIYAQSTLAPGDIAIIGYNYDASPQEMTIVTLVPISLGTQIRITDYAYDEATSAFGVNSVANTNEGSILWTTASAIVAGTVIKFTIAASVDGYSPAVVTGLPGTVSVSGWTGTNGSACPVPSSGDNWFIFQGSNSTTVGNFIFAWANTYSSIYSTPGQFLSTGSILGVTNSFLPSALTIGISAIALTGNSTTSYHGDNNVYTGTKSGTKTTLRAAICNTANWTTNETTVYDITAGGTNFPSTNPIFTLNIITATTSQTNVACKGNATGSMSVYVSGGAPPYTYSWTPSGGSAATAVGLPAGNYNCNITDAEQTTITKTFTLTEPTSALTVTVASHTNVSVSGGSDGAASINFPTGGTGPYTYNWTPGNPSGDGTVSATGLTAGTWTCIVTDANACVVQKTFLITEPLPLPPGNALYFDGTDDYVEITNTITTDNENATISLWYKPTGAPSSQESVIQRGIDGFGNGWSIGLSRTTSNTLKFGIVNTNPAGVEFTGTTALTSGRWYHIAGTWDASTGDIKLYINGILEGSANSSNHTLRSSTKSYVIGKGNASSEALEGAVDEVQIWNTVRTQAQIQASMYDTISSASAGLKSYFHFDNGTAGGTNTGLTTATDATANGNNGTLNNFALTGSTSNWVESYGMVVPTATAATSVTASGFTANWTAPVIGTVNNYLLDVSTSPSFVSVITGSPFSVSGTSKAFVGLSGNTNYYYRIRAEKASVTGQGGNSNIIMARTGYLISGIVSYDNTASTPLNGLKLYLRNSTGTIIDSTTTNTLGQYNFTPQLDGNYTVSVISNIAWGGVNSADALVIQRNFAGILATPLSGIRLRAGNTNNDVNGIVNSGDALLIKRRFATLISSFPSGDWTFNPDTIRVNGAAVTMNFKGLCFGDVNGTYVPTGSKGQASVEMNKVGTMVVNTNTVDIPVKITHMMSTGAISMVLTYPENALDVISVSSAAENISGLVYSIKNGKIYLAWSSLQAFNVQANDVVFSIKANVLSTSSSIDLGVSSISEFANADAEVISQVCLYYPELIMATSITENTSNNISISIYPNPFTSNTTISYELQFEGSVFIGIYDVNGKLIRIATNENQTIGKHIIDLDGENLAEGLYHVQMIVSSGSKVIVGRSTMMKIK